MDTIIRNAVQMLSFNRQQLIIQLLTPVKHDLAAFTTTLRKIHVFSRKARNEEDNDLCKEKCKAGPVIYNLTEMRIPTPL